MDSFTNTSGPEELSRQLAESVLFVTVIIGLYLILGLFGNATVVYVYYYKYPRCNFKYFVISLAIIDITSCLTTLPAEMFGLQHNFNYPDNSIWLCKLKVFFNGFTVFISAFLLLLISIDRYRKVCCPLGWQIRPHRALQLSVMIFGVALVLASPAPFMWGKQTANVTYMGKNFMITLCEKSDDFKNTKYPKIFLMLVFFLPTISFMIITIVLYGLMLKEIFWGALAFKNNVLNEIKVAQITLLAQKVVKIQVDNDSSVPEDSTSRDITLETDDSLNESDEEVKALKKSTQTRRKSSFATKKTIAKLRLRSKTLIMFTLTIIFFTTVMLYFGILLRVTSSNHVYVLEQSDIAALLFFFWRLYFINHVINPFVYGIMDTRFRTTLKDIIFCQKTYVV